MTRNLSSGPIAASTFAECIASCESLLEEAFWNTFFKCIGPFKCQAPQVTVKGYRLDAYIETDMVRIGIELDGKQYHDPVRDYHRDRRILSTGLLDEIIRIPFSAMFYFRYGTLRVLSSWHNQFALRSWDRSIVEFHDFLGEINRYKDDAYVKPREWIDWAEPNLEIFYVGQNGGWVCSPKTALNIGKENSRLSVITRQFSIKAKDKKNG